MKCDNFIDMIPKILEGDANRLEEQKFYNHIKECKFCNEEYIFQKEARKYLKKGIVPKEENLDNSIDYIMDKIDKSKYKNNKVNNLRKSYRIARKCTTLIAAGVIVALLVNFYPKISNTLVSNKNVAKEEQVTKGIDIKNIDAKTVSFGDIKDFKNATVKELPNDYEYIDMFDKDNLIVEKRESTKETMRVLNDKALLYNINSGEFKEFVSVTDNDNYISDIKVNDKYVVWSELSRKSVRNEASAKWKILFKKINDSNSKVLAEGNGLNINLEYGEIKLSKDKVAYLTKNIGEGDTNTFKFKVYDLENEKTEDIYTKKLSKKDPIFFYINNLNDNGVILSELKCESDGKELKIFSDKNEMKYYSYDLKTKETKSILNVPFYKVTDINDKYTVSFEKDSMKLHNLFNNEEKEIVNKSNIDELKKKLNCFNFNELPSKIKITDGFIYYITSSDEMVAYSFSNNKFYNLKELIKSKEKIQLLKTIYKDDTIVVNYAENHNDDGHKVLYIKLNK